MIVNQLIIIMTKLKRNTKYKNLAQVKHLHNLQNKHKKFVQHLITYYYNRYVEEPEIFKKVTADLNKEPDIFVKEWEALQIWTIVYGLGAKKDEITQDTIELVEQLIIEEAQHEVFKTKIVDTIYEKINHPIRRTTKTNIGLIYDRLLNADKLYVQNNHLYCPAIHDKILFTLFQSRSYRPNDFYNHFYYRSGIRFSPCFLQRQLQRVLDTPINKVEMRRVARQDVPNEVMNTLEENIYDFKQRGLKKQQIIDKIVFFFKTEGYKISKHQAKDFYMECIN